MRDISKIRAVLRQFWMPAIILATMAGLLGCFMQPPGEQNIPGSYTAGLPDGGAEILEIDKNGDVRQRVTMVNGRTITAVGRWQYDPAQRSIKIRGVYITVDIEGSLNRDMEKTTDTLNILAVKRSVAGKILLGYEEGRTFSKR